MIFITLIIFCYSVNVLAFKNIKIINLDLFDFNNNFYIIVTNNILKNKKLINEIENSKNSAIVILKNNYSKKDLKEIYEDDIYDKKFLSKDPWIFDKNGFIGSSDEFYRTILDNN